MAMIHAQRFVVTSTATIVDNNAIDAYDVFATGSFTHSMFQTHGGPFKVEQLNYLDAADNTAANLTFVFMNSNVSYGTIDSAPDMTDANALFLTSHYVLASASILDHTNFKFASVQPNIIVWPSAAGSSSAIYYAIATAGTPTPLTASPITVSLVLSAS
jgi:hypothetical protein